MSTGKNPGGAHARHALIGTIALFVATAASSQASAATCEDLAGFAIPNGIVTAAQTVNGGSFAPPDGTATQTNLPAFCRVAATLTPTSDSSIRVEVWMPLSTWNGRMQGLGGGGYTGTIAYSQLATALRSGFAATNTDMGTFPATSGNGLSVVGHPEKQLDFGARSTHLMTVTAKNLMTAFYTRSPDRSYFVGCSTGGHQAFLEAQVFPNDYDGIIAGAPGHNRTHLHANFVADWVASHKAPGAVIPPAKLTVLRDAVINACRGKDGGAVTDNFLNDPRDCSFDPATIQCTGADNGTCLTAGEVATAKHMYDGLRNPRTGELIYPGWSRGSELGWTAMQGNATAAYPGILNWVLGANYDPLTTDFDTAMAAVDATLAPAVNFMSTDLSRFTSHGGKMILYHGGADPTVAVQDTINYYERLSTERNLTLQQVQQNAKLYLAPGMGHCSGGEGPNTIAGTELRFGFVSPLVDWVENGVAPGSIVASKITNGVTTMTRPLCPYPAEARYSGSGAVNDAANWTCIDASQPNPANQKAAPRYLAPFTIQARALPDTVNLRTTSGLVTVVLQAPAGSEDFRQWIPGNLRAEGAAAVSGSVSADGRTYVASFRRQDLASFNGGKAPGNAVELMVTGTLQKDGRQSLFATGATVRVVK